MKIISRKEALARAEKNKIKRNAQDRERYHSDPEFRERKLKRRRERYHNDPEFRERTKARERGRQNTPEVRARRRSRYRERRREDPEFVEQLNLRSRKYYYKDRECKNAQRKERYHSDSDFHERRLKWARERSLLAAAMRQILKQGETNA